MLSGFKPTFPAESQEREKAKLLSKPTAVVPAELAAIPQLLPSASKSLIDPTEVGPGSKVSSKAIAIEFSTGATSLSLIVNFTVL